MDHGHYKDLIFRKEKQRIRAEVYAIIISK